MDAWRVNEQSEPLEELERSERESRGSIQCGMGKTIDDALASRRTVPGSLEPFEGEGRTRTDVRAGLRAGMGSSPGVVLRDEPSALAE